LVKRGHEVRVYSFNYESNVFNEDYMGYNVTRLPIPAAMTLDTKSFEKAMGEDFCHTIQKLWPGLLTLSVQNPKIAKAFDSGASEKDFKSQSHQMQNRLHHSIKKIGNLPGIKKIVKPLSLKLYLALQRLLESEISIPIETKIENEMAETRQRLQMNLDTF